MYIVICECVFIFIHKYLSINMWGEKEGRWRFSLSPSCFLCTQCPARRNLRKKLEEGIAERNCRKQCQEAIAGRTILSVTPRPSLEKRHIEIVFQKRRFCLHTQSKCQFDNEGPTSKQPSY